MILRGKEMEPPCTDSSSEGLGGDCEKRWGIRNCSPNSRILEQGVLLKA